MITAGSRPANPFARLTYLVKNLKEMRSVDDPWPFDKSPTLSEFISRIKMLEDYQWPHLPMCSEGICEGAIDGSDFALADIMPSEMGYYHCAKVEDGLNWCIKHNLLKEVDFKGPSRGIAITDKARLWFKLSAPGGSIKRQLTIKASELMHKVSCHIDPRGKLKTSRSAHE